MSMWHHSVSETGQVSEHEFLKTFAVLPLQYNSLTRRTRRQISRKCKSRKVKIA